MAEDRPEWDETAERKAAEQAAANAALEGITLAEDERALVERRRRRELTQEEFLAEALALAVRKSAGQS
jgi:hypothetical protein